METVDGDGPDDRRLVIGCEDGYVRVWDQDALDDDGTRRDSYAIWALGLEMGADWEKRYQSFRLVLANDQQGARFGIACTNEPETPTQFTYFDLRAGRNPCINQKFRGAYCFVRLGNSKLGQGFAYEGGIYKWVRAGRVRPRQLL